MSFSSSLEKVCSYIVSDAKLLNAILDGSDLLQLSRKFNVHISVKPNPLAIYLEGSRESVEAVERYVDDVRKVRYCFWYHWFLMFSLISRALWRTLLTRLPHVPFPKKFFREFRAFPGPSWRTLVVRK